MGFRQDAREGIYGFSWLTCGAIVITLLLILVTVIWLVFMPFLRDLEREGIQQTQGYVNGKLECALGPHP